MISYFKTSRSNTYGLLFVLPLILIYEACVFIGSYSSLYSTRNGAEAFIKNFVNDIFNSSGQFVYAFLIALILLVLLMSERKKFKHADFKVFYFLLMFVESFVFAICLVLIMAFSKIYLLSSMTSDIFFEEMYLSIGAGIWEELIFRLFLLSSLLMLTEKILNFGKTIAVVFALAVSSVVFSYFHHVGSFGEVFSIGAFMARSIAGVFLGSIFLLRGIGISVYTHSIYDTIVVFFALGDV